MNELFSYVCVGLACWLARDSLNKDNMLLANLVAADFLFFFAWDVIWFESSIPGGTWMYVVKSAGGYLPFMLAYMAATMITLVKTRKSGLGIYLSILAAFAFSYNGVYNAFIGYSWFKLLSDYQLVMGVHMALQLIGVFVGVRYETLYRFISRFVGGRHIGFVFNRWHTKHHA